MKGFLTTTKGKVISGVATLGVGAAVVATVLVMNRGYRVIAVQALNGITNIVNGANSQEAYVGLHLEEGDDVTVTETADLTLALDQDKYVYAEPKTHFWIEAAGKTNDTRTVVHMDEGSTLVRVDNKLGESESFGIETTNATMSIRGTVVRTNTYSEGTDTITIVEVYEGEVYTEAVMENDRHMKDSRVLHSGESATIRSNSSTSEFVVDEATGEDINEINYKALRKETAQFLGKTIDEGRTLSIGKELLYDYVELIDHEYPDDDIDDWILEGQAATCEADGYYFEICSICGQQGEKVVLEKLGHDLETTDVLSQYCGGTGYKANVCKRCGMEFEKEEYKDERVHSFGDGTIVKDATETEDGVIEYKCELCGYVKTSAIPKTGRTKKKENDPVAKLPQNPIVETNPSEPDSEPAPQPAACEHDYATRIENNPTCEATGKRINVCKKCGYTVNDTIPATGHAYSEPVVVTAPTCTESGIERKTCTNTGCRSFVDSQVEALGHDFSGEETVISAATCSQLGAGIRNCARRGCTAYTNVTFPGYDPNNHVNITFTPDREPAGGFGGTHSGNCRDCGATISSERCTAESWTQIPVDDGQMHIGNCKYCNSQLSHLIDAGAGEPCPECGTIVDAY